jgi:hypothetical protein
MLPVPVAVKVVTVGAVVPKPIFKTPVVALLTSVPAPERAVATVNVPVFVNVPVTTVVGAVKVYVLALVNVAPDPTVKVPAVKVTLEPVVQLPVPLKVIFFAAVTRQVTAPVVAVKFNVLYAITLQVGVAPV